MLTFNLGTTYAGTAPNGSAPWLTAVFSDTGSPGVVQLTLTATNLNGTEDVDNWGFNINPSLDSQLANLKFTHISGGIATGIDLQADNSKGKLKEGPSFGYDINFDLGQGTNSVMKPTDTSVYDLKGITGLSADSFNFPSQGSGPAGNFFSAAHVQNTGSDFGSSGWIGAGGGTLVPEPENVGLILAGLAFAGFALVKRYFHKPGTI